jgi:aminoglycoside phosphotransferase (APT) family kinase protein
MVRVDPERLATVASRHLGEPVTVEDLRRLSGGASRETWSFDALSGSGTRHGLVLRRDPGSNTIGSSDRSTEYELVRAAAAAGVPAPAVRFLLAPEDGVGDGFVMDRVEGETIPRKILRDDAYADARPVLAHQCGEIAARIHAIDTSALPVMPVQGALEQLDQYRALLDGFREPHPVFELALRWLEDHAPPAPDHPRLVHGDFRNGNFIVGPEGVRAVLDWELAHLGDPVEDLGWLCVKSWRFGNDSQRAGGFGSVDELLAGYRAGGGTEIDRETLRYWETLGTLKWGAICELQCFTHLNGLVRSVELAILGRRICETEWDLLELLAPAGSPSPPPTFVASDAPGATKSTNVESGVESGSGPISATQDRPTAAELLEAVREFLERDVMPAVEGRVAFHTRVAVNALGMLEREATLGPTLDAEERHRLATLLGHDGSLAELTVVLAAEIRSGALDHRRDDVIEVLRTSVGAKLAVANPGYV